jgi:hypothetical protein
MQQTLQTNPDRFGLYNNGITIVVADFTDEDGGIYALMDPYIVNGCQTTRTVWEVFRNRLEAGGTGNDPELDAWQQKANKGVVVTKVVKVGSEESHKITRYTNSQTAVRAQDFISLESGVDSWSKQMADKYGVFLEVQRGAWDSQRAFQKQQPSKPQFDEDHWANLFSLIKVFGAGWLGEAGTAAGKNAPFVPDGAIYKKIMTKEKDDDGFGVKDLYAAYRLQAAANKLEFGRSGKETRRKTRFLFYMAVVELLKGVMIRAVPQLPSCPGDLTRALLNLFDPKNEEIVDLLLETAVELIDEYMTPGVDDSITQEPGFSNDIGSYLKAEQLGKTDLFSPHFRSQVAAQQKMLGKGGKGSSPSARDRIIAVIRGAPVNG